MEHAETAPTGNKLVSKVGAVRGFLVDVRSELKKVTWPTAKEVRSATMVVIVMAIISALILGLFDFVWSNVTELVYG
jgi:preprotein translocase subunit SecE